MHKLIDNLEKEMNKIVDKGLNSSNLEPMSKLVDIYKDIYETKCFQKQLNEGSMERYDARARDSRGRFMDKDWDRYDNYDRGDYGYHNLDDRTERYINRMKDGMETYNAGRTRYRGSEGEQRMIDGIEMTMSAICNFVESLFEYAETSKEKDIIRKHVDKMKNF